MSRAETVTAYVGLGANLADPRAQVLEAMDELDRVPQTRVTGRSSLYRSAPVGYAEQPYFVNAVARLETGLSAGRLLAELLAIERRHRRVRSTPNAPRSLDLDLLLYGETRIESAALSVPHPRMHERAFVLKPLLELAPEASIPGRGPLGALLRGCAGQTVERIG
jgi:2-amino-4-hydroxy-6-hydroxymethyldihydropteridine diphosphokinase